MGLAEEMTRLAETIVSEKQQRVSDNETLKNDIHEKLNDFSAQRVQVSKALEQNAKELMDSLQDYVDNTLVSENEEMQLQIKEFMQKLETEREERNKVQTETLNQFNKNLESSVAEMMKLFSQQRQEMKKQQQQEFYQFMVDLKSSVGESRKAAQQMLGDFKKENQERAKTLQKELSGFANDLAKSSKTKLKEYAKERKQAQDVWAKMQKNGVSKKKPASKKSVEAKEKKPIEPKEENPEFFEIPSAEAYLKPEEPQQKSQKGFTDNPKKDIQEHVFDYIQAHPEGVKVSEMEGPLNENRLKLGVAARKLLEENRVKKIENMYLPL